MSKNKKKTYFNRMSTRILTAVVVGMLSIAALVIFTMVKMSEKRVCGRVWGIPGAGL